MSGPLLFEEGSPPPPVREGGVYCGEMTRCGRGFSPMNPEAWFLSDQQARSKDLTGRQQSVRYRFPWLDGLAQRRRTLSGRKGSGKNGSTKVVDSERGGGRSRAPRTGRRSRTGGGYS